MVREAWVRWAYHAVIKLARQGIEGDLVEAGVFRGGTSCMLARAELFALGAQRAAAAAQRHEDRRLWLFDTFDGLPPPGERDETLLHEAYSAVEAMRRGNTSGLSADQLSGLEFRLRKGYIDRSTLKWNHGSEAAVRHNLDRTGYPPALVQLVRGKVEDTLRDRAVSLPQRIALLRLDTDFYSSTRAELAELWPRLVPGGVLVVDDFWTCISAATRTLVFPSALD